MVKSMGQTVRFLLSGLVFGLSLFFTFTKSSHAWLEDFDMAIDVPGIVANGIKIGDLAVDASRMVAVVEKAQEFIKYVGNFKDKMAQMYSHFCSVASIPSLKLATVIMEGGTAGNTGLKGAGRENLNFDAIYKVVMASVSGVSLKNAFDETQVINLSTLIQTWIEEGTKDSDLFNKIKEYIAKSECNFDAKLGEFAPQVADLRAIDLGASSINSVGASSSSTPTNIAPPTLPSSTSSSTPSQTTQPTTRTETPRAEQLEAARVKTTQTFFYIENTDQKINASDLEREEKDRAARTKALMEYAYKTATKELAKMDDDAKRGEDDFSKIFQKAENDSDDAQNEIMTNTSAWLLVYNQVAQMTAYTSLELMVDVIKETNNYNSLNKRNN